jgi:putative transposase
MTTTAESRRNSRQAHPLLQRFVALRPVRAHEGSVIALASNQRWSSDVLEIICRNGEVVRVAFAIDTCDREIIAWHATTAGISGEMVRDLMLACVEQRFAATRAPHPVQWLADNDSPYTARETLEFAMALGLVARFTLVGSPESDGVSEAFVKTLRRDYTRIHPRPDATTVLQMLPLWIERPRPPASGSFERLGRGDPESPIVHLGSTRC